MSAPVTRKANMKPIQIPFSIIKTLLASLAVLAALSMVVTLNDADAAQSGKFQYTDTWAGQPSGQFSNPSDVAVASNGNVYVLDTNNNRVQVFTQDGTYLFQFGSYGTTNGLLKAPLGIKIYGTQVYIADSGNNRIQIFNLSGEYIAKFGTTGSGNGQFSAPRDVAVAAGFIYVADSGNNRIQTFQQGTNTYVSQFGTAGAGNGQFSVPFGVEAVGEYDDAICSGGGYRVRVYVADTLNSRIQRFEGQCALGLTTPTYQAQWAAATWPYKVKLANPSSYTSNVYVARTVTNLITEYTPTGTAGASWGSQGTGDGQFRQPNGLGINPANGRVFVADSINNRVQRFSATGTFQTKWGISQSGNGEFSGPTDVARDSSGNIYVVDRNNDRVQKFNSSGKFLLAFGGTGSGNGQLSGPYGIYVSATDQIYVADRLNNRIQIFDTSGNYVNQWGTAGSGNGQFSNPTDMTMIGNSIYVVDQGNNRIQAFTAPGVYANQWGTAGSGNSQFSFAKNIITAGIYLFVTDNTRVQQFNFLGTFVNSTPIAGGPAGVSWNNNILGVTLADTGQVRLFTATAGGTPGNGQTFCTNGSGSDQASNPLGLDLYPGGTFDAGPEEYDVRALVADTANNRVKRSWLYITDCQSEGMLGNSDFDQPSYSAIAPNGDIYTADSNNNRVTRFDSSGNVLTRWGFGSGTDGFTNQTRGITVASDGTVYVADGSAIRGFNATGTLLNSVAISLISDLQAGTGGQVYASNGTTITRYNSSLVSQGTFGSAGSGNGQLLAGSGLGITPGGDLLVADQGNNRVQRFSSTGTYISQFATPSPKDVYWGPDGRIFVTSNDNVVRVYASFGGALVEQWGSTGENIGQFTNARGIAVTPANRVIVNDINNDRLQLFDWLPSRVQYSSEATDYAGNQVNVPNLDTTTVEGGF